MNKIAFTFWSGSEFSLLNLISLLSFSRLHPDFKLIIYTSDGDEELNVSWKTGEHNVSILNKYSINLLEPEPNIEIIKLSKNHKFYSKLKSAVHMADFVRIEKLYEHGGIWIDSDILFQENLLESISAESLNFSLIAYHNTITTGFVSCDLGQPFVSSLYESSIEKIESKSFETEYQGLGPDLWSKTYINNRHQCADANFLPIVYFYPYKWFDLDNFYNNPAPDFLGSSVIGVHWYNGNEKSKIFINNRLEYVLNRSVNDQGTPISKIIWGLNQRINLKQFIDPILG